MESEAEFENLKNAIAALARMVADIVAHRGSLDEVAAVDIAIKLRDVMRLTAAPSLSTSK
jgi:hypothetical protein